MHLVLEGIIFGLSLSFLLGPIFLVLVHSSVQYGKVSGLLTASGVWISDVLFITFSYLFIQQLQNLFDEESFMQGAQYFGSFIIIAVGIGALFVNKKPLDPNKIKKRDPSKLNFFLRGFFVNTLNPFTIIFWLGVMGGYVISKKLDGTESLQFFSGILIIIILTDYLKVLLADRISKYLTQRSINTITKIAGVGLILFGVYLLFVNS